MAVSRPLLLALVGAILMVSTFVAARGARETAAEPASQAVVPPGPAQNKAPGARPEGAKMAKPDGEKPGGSADRKAEKPKEARAPGEPKPKPPAAPRGGPVATVPGIPAPAARALSRNQILVLFFRQRAADDTATAAAVAGVKGTKGVAVFQEPITKLASYRGLVSGLGIKQAPVVIVVDRARQARVIEGYLDPASLKQLVKDAR